MFVGFDVGETLIRYEGVALDWSAHYRPALLQAVAQCGRTAEDAALDAACSALTRFNTRVHPRASEIRAGEAMERVAAIMDLPAEELEAHFFAYFQRRCSPMPGADALLRTLRLRGAWLAALSDVPYGMPTRMLVEDLGSMAGHFAVIASSCDVGVRKPLAKGLLELLRQSGRNAAHAVYIGNEEKDIQVARIAGMRSILLTFTPSIPDYGQTHTARSLPEVGTLIG